MDVNLILFKKNGSQKSFALPSSITVIGRRKDCDLCIPLEDVSRRHCQFDRNDEVLQIRDLGSRNGTFLNGEQVNGETTVKPGDYIQIGPLTFQFQIDGQPAKTTPPKNHSPKAEKKQPAGDDDDLLDLDIDEDMNVDLDEDVKMDLDDSGQFLDDLEKP
jgi:pSer/pThr/pTyr-binding forkhead associated (FHA) protein